MAKIPINIKTGNVEKVSDLIIGIDLGTTNSLVAYMKDGQPRVVKDIQGHRTLVPSIIHFTKDGHALVGDEAKKQLVQAPERTIFSVKRLMGKSYKDISEIEHIIGYTIIDEDTDALVKIKVDNKFYTPIELSAEILKSLKKRIELELNQKVNRAVITVPAYFNDAQRQATRDAGKLAGLEVLRIVNEPTAASLAYGIGLDPEEEKTIAVYDLGGGTFDISILQIQNGIFEVLSTNGDTFLGGDDFDRKIIEYWQEVNSISNDVLKSDKSLGQLFRTKAEEAKKQLSSASDFEHPHDQYDFKISKTHFESLVKPLIEKTIICCKKAIKDAEINLTDINHVVMVGGSTRTPLVNKMISAFFDQAVYNDLNPDEVVAMGAAIQADVLAGNNKNVLLLDVTPLSLGIETVGGLMDTIIPRNSKVPVKAGRQYTTSVEGQKNIRISIYQGERDLVENNRKLGEFILSGIPPMAAGMPKVEVHFIINADGILTVKSKELRSGTETQVEIKSQYGISEEEMAKMLIDSISNAESDMHKRALLEAQNEGKSIVQASEKFVEQNKNILSEEETKKTLQLASELKTAIESGTKDDIHLAIENLNNYTAPLAQTALDVNIANALKGREIK